MADTFRDAQQFLTALADMAEELRLAIIPMSERERAQLVTRLVAANHMVFGVWPDADQLEGDGPRNSPDPLRSLSQQSERMRVRGIRYPFATERSPFRSELHLGRIHPPERYEQRKLFIVLFLILMALSRSHCRGAATA